MMLIYHLKQIYFKNMASVHRYSENSENTSRIQTRTRTLKASNDKNIIKQYYNALNVLPYANMEFLIIYNPPPSWSVG